MKKKIMIMLIAIMSISLVAFSLAINDENAAPEPTPVNWSFAVSWDDSNCNCNVYGATLAWRAYYWDNAKPGWTKLDGASGFNISPSLGEICITPNVNLPFDCNTDKCYRVAARITYYDQNNQQCCAGEAYEDVTSDALMAGSVVVEVVLN